ncbi:MAG: phage DNA encapsidation protein [Bacteroidales bacterium]|nr:phage DNA encapsidation protein [Bacteroidales bacterium]
MPLRKPKYYDISHLVRDYPDAYYYVAFGERSNGKTYSALDYALERYYSSGEQFAYIRRFGQDIKKKNLQNLLSSHIENGRIEKLSKGEFSLVDYTSGMFVPYSFEADTKKIVKAQEPIGFAFDLNAMEHHKSTSYPKITTVIFDEFLSRQGYLTNEFILFMNTLSTIIRDRVNVKIFMIGNTVNRYCPYFQEMGLTHIKDQQPGSVDVYHYAETGLQVVVEYCDPMAKRGGKQSDVYFAFDNPQLKMITGGAWEIAIYPHLPKKYRPMDIVTNFFVEFEDVILHCELVATDDDYYIFVHPKTTPIKDESEDIIYGDKPNGRWNYRIGIGNQIDQLSMTIKRIIKENRVFYSDNETGEVLRNYLIWSVQYSSARGG